MKIFLISITLIFFQFNCYASNTDPSKESLLETLHKNPNSKSLWAAYIGKSWVCMTKKEKTLIRKLRMSILSEKPDRKSVSEKPDLKEVASTADILNSSLERLEQSIKMFMATDFEKEKKEWDYLISQAELTLEENQDKKHKLLIHLNTIEKSMTNIPNNIMSLSDNLNKNFTLVEDELEQEFFELDSQYTFYSSLEDGNKVSQDQWIQMNIKKLRKLKQIQFLAYRNQVIKNAFNL